MGKCNKYRIQDIEENYNHAIRSYEIAFGLTIILPFKCLFMIKIRIVFYRIP